MFCSLVTRSSLRLSVFRGLHTPASSSSSSSSSSRTLSFDEYPGPEGGTLPPLVILHGLYGSKQNWRTLARKLPTDLNRTVIAVDMPNHGESYHTDQMSYESLAMDLKGFLKSQDISRAVILGHSMVCGPLH